MAARRRTGRTTRTGLIANIRHALSGGFTRILASVRPEPGMLRRAAMGLLWAAGLTGLVVALGAGVPRLEQSVGRARWVAAHEYHFTLVPDWVDHALLESLARCAEEATSGDPLRQVDLVAIRDALLATGWFDRIRQVSRLDAHRIRVDGDFAIRFAAIQDADGEHVVDPGGKLLPESHRTAGGSGLIVITGAKATRPALPGRAWPGVEVEAALALLARLDAPPWRQQIAAIDVRAFREDGTLTIVTETGARIVWGSPPGRESSFEILAEDKIRILDRAVRDYGRIDCGFIGTWYFLREGYFSR